MNKASKIIALTPGSEAGVGPELMIKAVDKLSHDAPQSFFWCGDRASLELAAARSQCKISFNSDEMANVGPHQLRFFAGGFSELDVLSRQALALQKAVELAHSQKVQAIVTGPIEKSALVQVPGSFVGQTEFFAHHLAKPGAKPFMAFMGGPFILSMLTTHCPLKDVAGKLSQSMVLEHLRSCARECAAVLNKPAQAVKITMLGLNPHAGEHGLLGREELDVINPAIEEARALGLQLSGPLPADGFFSYFHLLPLEHRPDVVVASYHDQGLIPYKLLTRGTSTNVTLGLSIPRTSPSHGTAPQLVGTGVACEQSTLAAIKTALQFFHAV